MLWTFATAFVFAFAASSAVADDADVVSSQFASLAQRSDADSMAALFHYPPSYSKAERRDDEAAVARSLSWLLSKLGEPQSVEPSESPAIFYEVGVYGGDNPYWESISPIDETQYIYEATFPKAGPGFLRVLVFRPKNSSEPEIHAAAFGIATSTPGAKETVIELMLGLLDQSGTPAPPGLREALEEQLQPTQAAPGS